MEDVAENRSRSKVFQQSSCCSYIQNSSTTTSSLVMRVHTYPFSVFVFGVSVSPLYSCFVLFEHIFQLLFLWWLLGREEVLSVLKGVYKFTSRKPDKKHSVIPFFWLVKIALNKELCHKFYSIDSWPQNL